MARTMCSDCGTRPVSTHQRGAGGSLCQVCEDYAGWENEHNDNDHDNLTADDDEFEFTTNCPVCHPELDNRVKQTGHTNTAARTWTSHTGCNHPRNPKARAACRKAGGPTGTRPATD